MPGAESIELERSELRELLEAALQKDGRFKLDSGSEEGKPIRLAIGKDSSDETRVALSFARSDDSPVIQADFTIAYRTKDEIKSALSKVLLEGLKEIGTTVEQLNKKEGALKAIQAYIKDQDVREGMVTSALEQISVEKDKSTIPYLVAALKLPNIRVSMKVLQTLGALKDPSTVNAITEFAERKPPEIRRHAIEAAKEIGGDTAAAWLFTLSTGHPDANVRAASKEALKEVEASRKSS